MGNSRLDLHNELIEILGSNYVYYQPPESIKINYPAIIYRRSNIINRFANDNVYGQKYIYEITVVDYNPDSEIVIKMSKMKTVKFIRHFTANNLNHDLFTIIY